MYKSKSYLKRDWFLDEVYNDSDFKSDVNNLSAEAVKSKYKISDDELDFYKDGSFKNGRFINRRKSLSFYTDEKNKEITVKIGADATLTDFKNAWPIVRALKWSMFGQEERRYRSPDNPSIVYKVFRLKESGLSQSDIYDLYKSGNLLEKSYNTEQFLTAKDLIEYCRPYFPKA